MRQLAAILFADIVGYTALMGRDEEQAFQAVTQFKMIALPLVEQHQGRWHKDLGDGALCSFGSALEAVQSAVAIQRQLNAETDFRVRIGIHLGDVTYRDGDVFGDGVNVASRMQGEAAPGGICVSESIVKAVRNQKEVRTESLGKKTLKNVGEPLHLYQLLAEGVNRQKRSRSGNIPLKPAVVILLFSVLLAGSLGWLLKPVPQPPWTVSPKHYKIRLPEQFPLALSGNTTTGSWQTALAIAPDGSKIVYVGKMTDGNRLVLHALDREEYRILPGTEDPFFPFFSPDGEWVAFFAGNVFSRRQVFCLSG